MASLEFLKFVNASPSPFHAVDTAINHLQKAGFNRIYEHQPWLLKPNHSYYFTRNASALIAFRVGGQYTPGNGFLIVGAHTDSPCFKVKPISKRERGGYAQVGVETYGGGLWHTWFDRELSLAGRVLVNNNGIEHKLVDLKAPILRIPTLAIHLDRGANDGFSFNKEVQLTPVLGQLSKELQGEGKHHAAMLELIAKQCNCTPEQIEDFELCLYDTQPAQLGGINNEFIHSARLDNLMMSFCSLQAIIESKDLENDKGIRITALFDNEEVGSNTAHGADSNLLEVTLKRLAQLPIGEVQEGSFERAMTQSLLISADMAHALHPNYMEKHEDLHRPKMNGGVVIKQNANQRYATTSITTNILRQAAKRCKVELQEFVVRNDSPCGSTIGPMLSAKLGLKTIDVGNPQWSMHSVRETCGTKDVDDAILLFKTAFEQFTDIQEKMPRL